MRCLPAQWAFWSITGSMGVLVNHWLKGGLNLSAQSCSGPKHFCVICILSVSSCAVPASLLGPALENRFVFRSLFHLLGTALENKIVFQSLFHLLGPALENRFVFRSLFHLLDPALENRFVFRSLFHLLGPTLENRCVFRSLFHLLDPALENRRRDNAHLRTLMHGFPVGRLYPISHLGKMQDSCHESVN